MSWTDAHLFAAATYLKRDEIKKYLKHIDLVLYQYPALKDFKTLLTYFYHKNKVNMSDYTPKRAGIIQLYRGQYDDAIKLLTAAYKSNRKDPMVLYNLAAAYVRKEDFKTALDIVNECLIVSPKYPGAIDLKRQIMKQSKTVRHH